MNRQPASIVIILADDMGWGDLSCYGQKAFSTPCIDRMARDGIRHTDAYASAPFCAPTRYSMLTGLHQGHSWIRGFDVDIRAEDAGFVRILRSAGYRTGLFGKWGLGQAEGPSSPRSHGFNEFVGFLDHTHAHDGFPDFVWRGSRAEAIPRGLYVNRLFTDEAIRFIRRHHRHPFLCCLHLTTPHAHSVLSENGMQAPGANPFADRPWPEVEKNFAHSMVLFDKYVGEVRSTLARLGIERNTLVIVTSDNGGHRAGGHSWEFFRSNGHWRDGKFTLWEGGVRVPFIACWPACIRPGITSNAICSTHDLPSTCLDAAGLGPMPPLQACPTGGKHADGASLLPVWRGEQRKIHDWFYSEYPAAVFQQSCRWDHWKAIRIGSDNPVQLYDLAADPSETIDVAQRHPDVVARLDALMRREHVDCPLFPGGPA